jgi:hypothetical protein
LPVDLHLEGGTPMKKLSAALTVMSAFILFAGSAGSAQAQGAKKSAVTIDSVTVTDLGTGAYKIVVQGTLTLGMMDAFTGVKFSFTDPAKNTVAPIVTQFVPPQPGFTTGYSYYTVSGLKGNWNAGTAMFYMTGNTPGIASTGKAFPVPTPP